MPWDKMSKAELIQTIQELMQIAQDNKEIAERAVKQIEERDKIATEDLVQENESWH